MIVIALSKVPQALSGDLTKWCQEIQTGIYVGNFSARIRDLLWERINKNIGLGEATMVYSTNNEIGYQIRTTRSDKEVVDFDGIPLIKILNISPKRQKYGFSNAYKYHQARKHNVLKEKSCSKLQEINNLASLDIETTGINPANDEILSVGAEKIKNNQVSTFYRIIKIDQVIPRDIEKLTNLNSNIINSHGIQLSQALEELKSFLEDCLLVGYNLQFDLNFLSRAYFDSKIEMFTNKSRDLLPVIKSTDKFLDDYRLQTVLKKYKIRNFKPHNSLSDAKATLELVKQLIKNGQM